MTPGWTLITVLYCAPYNIITVSLLLSSGSRWTCSGLNYPQIVLYHQRKIPVCDYKIFHSFLHTVTKQLFSASLLASPPDDQRDLSLPFSSTFFVISLASLTKVTPLALLIISLSLAVNFQLQQCLKRKPYSSERFTGIFIQTQAQRATD